MLKNIVTITIRSFVKEKYYSLINVLGLAMGIATSLLIAIYVVHEVSYDDFHPDRDRLYRVNMTNIWMPDGQVMSSSVVPLADVLVADYPEIESAMRINAFGRNIVRGVDGHADKTFYEDDILAADSNFFDFFDFKLLHGDPSSALVGVNNVVISREIAIKYFGLTDVVGETLLLGEDRVPVYITGVTDEQPSNVHFDFDFLLSMHTNPNIKQFEWSWIWTQMVTYVKVRPGINIQALEKKFVDIAPNYAAGTFKRLRMNYDEFMSGKNGWSFYLQPVRDIHLYSVGIGNRIGTVSDINYVYIFSATAFFILLLAIINFVNLSTARASIRAKEVGIRKVMGSLRQQLMLQFITESIAMSLLAGLIGLGLMEGLKVFIENYLGTVFSLTIWSNSAFFLYLFIGLLVIGIMAGLYPAFYLTAFAPASVLKGKVTHGKKSVAFRNSLVVIQFTVSIILMVCTVVVYQQLQFFNEKDLGYERENVIAINWADKLKEHLGSFRDEVAKHPDVMDASVSMDVIGRGAYEDLFIEKGSGIEQTIAMMKADEYHINTVGMEMAYGRFFDKDRPGDKQTIVINESTMELFGWSPENVLGQEIEYAGDDMGPARVIGVVRDFNFYSLRDPIVPYLFFHIDAPVWGDMRVLLIKTNGKNTQGLLAFLKESWEDRANGAPFEYSFLDEEYGRQYQEEQNLGVLFATFTIIALFIASLGLFGLASYTVGKRYKEIGIRKVLGASVRSIAFMLNGSYTRLIVISLILAIPVAWWLMDTWLERFVYRIGITWWVFAAAGVLVLAVAWLSVSYQSVKAAFLNPVETLKDE